MGPGGSISLQPVSERPRGSSLDTSVCEKNIPFVRAPAMQSGSKICSPAPNLALRKLAFRSAFFTDTSTPNPQSKNREIRGSVNQLRSLCVKVHSLLHLKAHFVTHLIAYPLLLQVPCSSHPDIGTTRPWVTGLRLV